jgi:hypothetical protein
MTVVVMLGRSSYRPVKDFYISISKPEKRVTHKAFVVVGQETTEL